jgi:hypothetical protein
MTRRAADPTVGRHRPIVHDCVDAEPVDGGVEEALGRGKVEDLKVAADGFRGKQGQTSARVSL